MSEQKEFCWACDAEESGPCSRCNPEDGAISEPSCDNETEEYECESEDETDDETEECENESEDETGDEDKPQHSRNYSTDQLVPQVPPGLVTNPRGEAISRPSAAQNYESAVSRNLFIPYLRPGSSKNQSTATGPSASRNQHGKRQHNESQNFPSKKSKPIETECTLSPYITLSKIEIFCTFFFKGV